MVDEYRYVVFEVDGRWFGFLGTEKTLTKTCLPASSKAGCKRMLLCKGTKAKFDKAYFKTVQNRITSYYKGKAVNFSDVPVDLAGCGDFTKRILMACRKIPSGKTLTYGQIAAKVGSPKAARAAGNALASNPVPLIIPCHRVICSNGNPGGFSGWGGGKMKKKMLFLEESPLILG